MKTIFSEEYKLLIKKLKKARVAKSLTQLQLAQKLGTDQSYVSKIEGLQRRIDVIELRTICRAMEISFLEFLQDFEADSK